MDRRKKLATAGAVSLTATAAVLALGASVGLFGLTDDSPRVGKLSPIDSTQTTSSTTPDDVRTVIVDDTPTSTASGTSPATTPNTLGNPATTSNTVPQVDDHGGDRVGDDDNSGPGSVNSGRDDDSGHGGSDDSGRDHPEDD